MRYFLLCLSLLFMGCASGHCRGKKENDQKSAYVFKEDGSRQCGGKGVSLNDMAKELSGIMIRSQENRKDGKMHIMMCGGPTGNINVYEIMEKDLPEAIKRGFQEFKK